MKNAFKYVSIMTFVCGIILIFLKGEEEISHLIKPYEGAPLFIIVGVVLFVGYVILDKLDKIEKGK